MPIYLIRRGTDGPVKIGFSRSLETRLRQLRIASHEPLALVAVIDGDRKAEAALHARFADGRLSGEWYAPTAELLALIAANPPVGSPSARSATVAREIGGLAKRMGGVHAFARKLSLAAGEPVVAQLPDMWRANGSVPSRWIPAIVRAAAADGIALSLEDVLALCGEPRPEPPVRDYLDPSALTPDAHAAYAEFCSAHPYPQAAPSP